MTDDELAVALSSGEDAVLAALYDRYAQRAMNYAFGILRNQSDSEDVVQEAFCRLMAPRQRHRLRASAGQLSAIFFTAVRNLSLDTIRRRKTRRQAALVDQIASPPADVSPSDEAELRGLVDQLPPEWSEALKLRVDGQLTYAEISEVMGCTLAQVRTRIYRARKQLTRELIQRGFLVNG